jgi:photosystem II stability/assembly factor-like uncharacterized protein
MKEKMKEKNLTLMVIIVLSLFSFLGYSSLNAQWTEQTTPITTPLHSVSAVDNNVVWACGTLAKVIKTTNGGTTWTDASGTGILAGLALYNIWGIDANNALVTGSSSSAYVFKTTDGGATWTQVFIQSGGFVNAINMSSATDGFFTGDPVGGNWSLWKTTNAGTNWTAVTPAVPGPGIAGWNNSLFTLGSKIWFGTNGTKLMYSTDGGSTWSSQTTTGALNTYAVWFNNANDGIAGGSTAGGVKTVNGGTTWSALIVSPLLNNNWTGITGTGSNWWVSSFTNIIWGSTNNGTTWSASYTATAGHQYYHITKARTGNNLWAVKGAGAPGKVTKYTAPTGITPISGQVPSDYNLSQNYPNPFNPTTNIKFSIPRQGFVTLKVFNSLGKEVATLVNEVTNAGTYVVDFDADNLTSGVYFYRLQSDNFTETKRMMLIK